MSKDQVIELDGEDGSTFQCQVLDILPFRNKEYAVLLELARQEIVIMEFIQKGDSGVFRTIESDEEFESVRRFVEAWAEDSK